MRWLACVTLVFVLLQLQAQEGPKQASPKLEKTKSVKGFALKDAAGETWSLETIKDKKAVVVIFLGTQCPINNAFAPRLAELHKEYADKGVQFLGINSNEQDSAKAIAEHAKKFAIPFPVLRDEGHRAADLFGAQRTPEAFLLDPKGTIHYQGRIDDQFGIGFSRRQPTRRDLAHAIDALLDGKEIATARTEVAGCIIARAPRPKEQATVTYAREVSRILQKNCQECHRPGQIGPMSLLTYEQASSWSDMIREVVAAKRMPPWHADARHGKFSNNRSLPKEELDALLAWIDQGCPKGNEADLPEPRKFAEGWHIGKPDVVFTMKKEFTVPAKAPRAGVKYQYFVVPTNFEEDRWIQAAEAIPGNRAVVHHIIVYVLVDGKRQQGKEDGIGNGYLTSFAPGDTGIVFPPGAAKKVPKGATLAFQMHYTPNGVEQTDRSSVGLVFAKKPPEHEVRTRAIAQQWLALPPGNENYKATSSTTFKKDVLLWQLFPHMHLRGKSFEYQVVYPDGKKEILLSVPRYEFGWQATYILEKPLRLPAGSKIECTAIYDNSAKNANNPDASRWVYWGDQTWEEMMIGFVDYTYVE